MKNNKKITCELCDAVGLTSEFKRAQGYGNHVRSAHPEIYSIGRRDMHSLPVTLWPMDALMGELAMNGFEKQLNDGKAVAELNDIRERLNLDTVALALGEVGFIAFLKGSLIIATIESDARGIEFYSERLLGLEDGE